jgi:hypothetical protein
MDDLLIAAFRGAQEISPSKAQEQRNMWNSLNGLSKSRREAFYEARS